MFNLRFQIDVLIRGAFLVYSSPSDLLSLNKIIIQQQQPLIIMVKLILAIHAVAYQFGEGIIPNS